MSNIQDKRNRFLNLQTVYNNYCKLNKTENSNECIQRKKILNTLKEEINSLQKKEDEKLAKIQAKNKKSWFSFGRNDNGYKRRSKKRSRNKSLNLQTIYNNYCKFIKIEDEKLAKNKRRSRKRSRKRSRNGSKRRSRKIN